MIEAYRGFFAASAGAAAAFIGLLFVALSFIDAAKVEESVRAWRRIIANSSFTQLINIFFVSLTGLAPDPKSVAFTACVMAGFGLVVALRLLPLTLDSKTTGRTRPTILGLVTVAAYVLQLVAGLGLLHNPNDANLMSYLAAALIILYAGALARAWEITGLKQH